MIFGKVRASGFYLLLISVLACNGQGFKGAATTQETERENADAHAQIDGFVWRARPQPHREGINEHGGLAA